MFRTLRAPAAALLSTTAFFALATQAHAQALDVPAGSTYTLTADEAYNTLTGAGGVVLTDHYLTIGADGSSSTFNGDISDSTISYVGSWVVFDGPPWGSHTAPVRSGTEAAAFLFGGNASDYRISTVSDQVSDIDDRAWYDVYGIGRSQFADDYRSDANGNGLYDQHGDSSAYVQDNYVTDTNYAFTGVNGFGGLTKVGSGTLTLAGTGDWSGLTTIDGGTLAGTTNSISGGSITNNATLAYNQAFSGTVIQNISGTGVVTVSGLDAGETLAFTGGSSVNGGTVVMDRSSISLSGNYSASSVGVALNANGAIVSVLDGSSLSGGTYGIYSAFSGQTINNLGSIVGSDYVGVRIAGGSINNGSATDSEATISGYYTGSSNTGDVVVNNYGTINGTLFNGLDTAGSLTLANYADGVIEGQGQGGPGYGIGLLVGGTLSGANDGMILGRFAGIRSNGALNFTNAGSIASGSYDPMGAFSYSDGNDGIQALGGGTITNLAGGQILGSISGIYLAGTPLTVVNDGTVHGNQYGVYADAAVYLTNNFSGVVDGGTTGIQLNRDGNSINNSGSITGATAIYGGSLTLDNAGNIQGSNDGIILTSGQASTLTNELGGTVQGGLQAIQNAGSGTVTAINRGDILGGFVSTGGGNLDINNQASGNIVRVVFGSAIDISNGGILTLTNAGDVVGSGWGVVGRNSSDSITNTGRIASGTISGNAITVSGANAIELQQGGTVTNLAGGQILGASSGVTGARIILDNRAGASISGTNAVNIGSGSRVTNAGTITGGTANGNYGVSINTNGTLNNLVGGTINGARATQFFGTGNVLTNSGTIASTAATPWQGFGAIFFNGGTVNNLSGGTIAGQYRGVAIQGGLGIVDNAGTIRSNSEIAVALFSGGTVTNRAGGLIDGDYRGILINGGVGNVTNAGAITARVDNAISLFSGGTVNNQVGGTLTALGTDGWGIYATGGAIDITNAGRIDADSGIVTNANGAVVRNSGIVNGTVNGVWGYNPTSLDLTNSGTITAGTGAGVRAEGALTLNNQVGGTIRSNGTGGVDGVTVFNGATASITNSGTISAANASGIAVTGTSTIANSGTITGGADANYGFGVQFAVGSSGSLVNQSGGQISGGTGSVIVVTDNDVSLDLQTGSTTTGMIASAGSGARTVTVGGTLNGAYDAAAGTGIDSFTLASTGAMTSASLGAGNDAFTSLGGAISGNVDGGAGTDSLLFNVAGSVTYAGNFTGFETGMKTGVGLVNLTGSNVVAAFVVNGGTLAINGSLASNVTVNSGGKLGGTGTIAGSLTIGSGGTLAPGNSIGTMNVAGNLTFASGSTYQVEITPTSADRVNASGNIVINGGTVSVLGGSGVYAPLTTYTILNAGGTVSGSFASVTDNLAFLDPTLVYTTNQVLLEMRRNDITFADVAQNPNQIAAANALQTLPAGSFYDSILVQSATGARQSYDALSGEIYASTQTVLAQQGDRLRVALLDADATGADGLALWVDAKAGHANLGATNVGSAPIVSDHRDIIVGAKWQGSGFSAAAGGGISRSDVDVARRDSSADIDSWMIGGQLGYRFQNLRVTGGLTYASHQIDTERAIVFPGFVDATSASQDATMRTIYGELAYRMADGAVAVEPFLGVANQLVRVDGMVEQGGDASLVVGSSSLNSTMTEVGVRVSGSAKVGAGSLYPIGTVAWQHLLGDRRGSIDAAFDIGGDPFMIEGAKRSRDGLRVNAGLGYRIGGATIGLSYDGRLSNSDTDHGIRLTAGVQF